MLRRTVLEPKSDDPKYLFHFNEANWGTPQVTHLVEVYTGESNDSQIFQIRGDILKYNDIYQKVQVQEHPLRISDVIRVGLPDIVVFDATMRMVGTPLIFSDDDRDVYLYQTDKGFFVHIRSRSELPSYPTNFTASVLYALQFRSMDFIPYEALYLTSENRIICYFSEQQNATAETMVNVRYPDMITEKPFVRIESGEDNLKVYWKDEEISLDLELTYEDSYAKIYRGPGFVLLRRKPKDYEFIEGIIGPFDRPGIPGGYRVAAVLLIVLPSLILLLLITFALSWIWRRTASPDRPPS